MSDILKKSLDKGILSKSDLKSDDESIIRQVKNCRQQEITNLLNKLKNLTIGQVAEDEKDFEYIKKITKFRAIDPLAETNKQIKRVTEIFPDFKEKFDNEKNRVNRPRYLMYSKPNNRNKNQ